MFDTTKTCISGYRACLGNDGALCSYVSAILSCCMKPLHSRHLSSRSEYKFSTPLTVARPGRQQAGICHLWTCAMRRWSHGGLHNLVTTHRGHPSEPRAHNGCIMILGLIFGPLWALLQILTSDDVSWHQTMTRVGHETREIQSPMSEEFEHCNIHK